jgi:hypothetical protein
MEINEKIPDDIKAKIIITQKVFPDNIIGVRYHCISCDDFHSTMVNQEYDCRNCDDSKLEIVDILISLTRPRLIRNEN